MEKKKRAQWSTAEKMTVWMLGAAVITVLLFVFRGGISGNDFWWHVKTGEWICTNKAVPLKDIFSWVGMEKGIDWTAHEWLSEVIFYLIYTYAGSIGMFVFSLAMSVCMMALLWREVREYAVNNLIISGIYFIIYAVICSAFFYGRPHMFGFFLLYLELKCLYQFMEQEDTKVIYFIPLIAVAWSNLHGGSANLAYLLCILTLVVSCLNSRMGRVYAVRKKRRNILRLGAVTILSVAGILVNPIGIRVLFYPYINLSDQLSMSVISEWHAPDAKSIAELLIYFLPIFIMTIGIVTEKVELRLMDVMVMLVFLYLFFRSSRFIALWYIAAAFYAFRYLPECRMKEIKGVTEKILAGVVIGCLVVADGFWIQDMVEQYQGEGLIKKVLSDEMIEVIKEENPERLLNDYNFGELLIYNEVEVFFDSRADLFAAENIMADGVSLMYLQQENPESETAYVDVEKLFEQYGFDAVVMQTDRPLYAYMMARPDEFECIYEEDGAGYFRVIKE